MNIYDKAYELVKALKDSEDFKTVLIAKEQLAQDAKAARMLEEFRNSQQELQQAMMSGLMPAQEEMQKIEKQYEVLNRNPLIRPYFEAERRLSMIMEDVNRIISEPIAELLK